MAVEKGLLSIIIPVYNVKEFLPRCVETVRGQTYTNLEILLIDDGSTDGTGQMCDALAKLDSRIRVFHKINGGSSSARNLGIREAKGAYLGFVDSDDYISPEMYERLLGGIEKYRLPIAQIGRDEIGEDGERRPDICRPPSEEIRITSADFLGELLMHRGDCSFCTKLVAREVFDSDVFPEGVLNEDFHLLVRVLQRIEGIVSLPGQMYHVFYRLGSNTRRKEENDFSRVFGDCVDNADMAARIVEDNYPELRSVALRFSMFQRLEYLLHIPVPQMTRENVQFRQIVAFVRKHWLRAMGNRYLTVKNKVYLTLFAITPKGIRVLHRKFRGLDR